MEPLAAFDWAMVFDVPTIIFVAGGLIAITSIIANAVVRVQRSSEQTRLKEQMIAKGFSPDEIERVLRAGSKRTD